MNKIEAFMDEHYEEGLSEAVLTPSAPVLATPAVTLAATAGVTGVAVAYAVGRTQGGAETGPAGGGGSSGGR